MLRHAAGRIPIDQQDIDLGKVGRCDRGDCWRLGLSSLVAGRATSRERRFVRNDQLGATLWTNTAASGQERFDVQLMPLWTQKADAHGLVQAAAVDVSGGGKSL